MLSAVFALVMLVAMTLMTALLVWFRLSSVLAVSQSIQKQLICAEIRMHELTRLQQQFDQRLDELASDVLNRDIYQANDHRHQQAIDSAREGMSSRALRQMHGLSSDEADLLLTMHASEKHSPQTTGVED
ncbi:MAG: hypothetical protein V3U76_08145 [Granulosicoccus sp.]